MRKKLLPLLLVLVLLCACGKPAAPAEAPAAAKPVLILDSAQAAEQDGVRLTVTAYSDGVLTVRLENSGDVPWNCCLGYSVQLREGNGWRELPWPEGQAPAEVCFSLRPGQSAEQTLDLAALALSSGEYRFTLGGLSAPFSLVWTE